MRAAAVLAAACVSLAAAASPAADRASAGKPPAVASVSRCDVRLNIIDPDPRGLNVRATPGRPAGRVLARLRPAGEWTEVHATGVVGDWLRIDRAETVDDDSPGGMREVWRGTGWVHVSGLGISELGTGEGTVLRASPSERSAALRAIDASNEPRRVRVLACSANWLLVEADGLKGWTRSWCNNQRTTCS